MTFLLETIRLGLSNLKLHLLRSFLTALGIILGISAVILMLAIAAGAEISALKQYEILGARVIILRSVRPPEREDMTGGEGGSTSYVTAFGLMRKDLRRLRAQFGDQEDGTAPLAEYIVPLKLVGAFVTRKAQRVESQAYGTTPDLPKCANFRLSSGRYLTPADLDAASSVCVIGHNIAQRLFPLEDPIGQTLRVDTKAFRVVGVMAPIGLAGGTGAALVGRDLNKDVHLPITTAEASFGDTIFRRTAGSRNNTRVEISEVYLSMPSLSQVILGSLLADRTVQIGHADARDVQMIVPYELLENAKRLSRTFERVMLSIAAIALLVGGIGIMNIMLASVTERTREIGIRRALGATKRHIVWQFLVETGVLSMLGGVLGIIFGIGAAVILGKVIPDQFPTMVTSWSVIVSFVVACGIGLIFGIYPATVAAQQDPIVALRHD